MNRLTVSGITCAVLGIATLLLAQTGQSTQSPATVNQEGTTQFRLAAPAGKDSDARSVAPTGAINQGPFDPATWKYGPAFNPPDGGKLWNPVKLKLLQGGKVTGGTLFSATDPATYCAMANAGTTSSGRRCSTVRVIGRTRRKCGAPAPTRRRFPVYGSPTPMSARSSMRLTQERWWWSCRPSTPSPRPSRPVTGPTSRRSGAAVRAVARRSTSVCGAAFPEATATPSTTMSC